MGLPLDATHTRRILVIKIITRAKLTATYFFDSNLDGFENCDCPPQLEPADLLVKSVASTSTPKITKSYTFLR